MFKRAESRQPPFRKEKLSREDLFLVASEVTDLRTGRLIIYPAGFMALINFPSPLSLPSIESLKSTCIWCW